MGRAKLLSIIIPAYNEEKTIKQLLNNVYKHKLDGIKREILIIESNSKDKTRQIVRSFAEGKDEVRVILEGRPKGKGHAVRRGFQKARGDIILIQDADLEYDVRDYDKLIKPILDKKAVFVLGSRHLTSDNRRNWGIRKFHGKERLYAYFMNFGGLLFHNFFNILYGTRISDPTTMYKVFDKKLLKQVKLRGNYFELDWEIVAKFVRLGHIPHEIPIFYESRSPKEGKKVKFSRDVLRWFWTIVKFRFLPIEKF